MYATVTEDRENANNSAFGCLRTPTRWHCPHSPAAAAAINRPVNKLDVTDDDDNEKQICLAP